MKTIMQHGIFTILVVMLTSSLMLLAISGCDEKKPPAAVTAPAGKVINVIAKQFEFTPKEITLKKGEPVSLEFTSADVTHGVNCPDLNIRMDINPGTPAVVNLTPDKAGRFEYSCDVPCGPGHREMMGTIIVTE